MIVNMPFQALFCKNIAYINHSLSCVLGTWGGLPKCKDIGAHWNGWVVSQLFANIGSEFYAWATELRKHTRK